MWYANVSLCMHPLSVSKNVESYNYDRKYKLQFIPNIFVFFLFNVMFGVISQ